MPNLLTASSRLIFFVPGYTWRQDSDAKILSGGLEDVRRAVRKIGKKYRQEIGGAPSRSVLLASSWKAAEQTARVFLSGWREFAPQDGVILNQYFDPDRFSRNRERWLSDWLIANLRDLSDPARDDCVMVVVTYPKIIQYLLGRLLPGELDAMAPTQCCQIEIDRNNEDLPEFLVPICVSCGGSRRGIAFHRELERFEF